MQIVSIPSIDRARVAAMIGGHKTSLLAALPRDGQTVGALIQLFFRHLAPIAAQRFGEDPALLLGVCTVRHNKAGAVESHPRHVDARFFPPTGNGLTFWCPLDEVGDTAPGVTVYETGEPTTPRLGPGQAMVIPPNLPHCTQALDGERISIEFRCAPKSRLPINLGESRIALEAEIDGRRTLLVAPAPQLERDKLCAIADTVDDQPIINSTY